MVNKEHTLKKLIIVQLMACLIWLIFFLSFNNYYSSVEILISDHSSIIEKVLIFVTYSKEKSLIYFGGVFIVITFLIGIMLKDMQVLKTVTSNVRLKGLLSFFVVANLAMILTFCRPIIYPIFILLTGIAGTFFYVFHVFNREVFAEEDYGGDYEEDYENDYEEDCEENNEE